MPVIVTKNDRYLNNIKFFNFLKSNGVLKVLFALIPVNKDLIYKFTTDRDAL